MISVLVMLTFVFGIMISKDNGKIKRAVKTDVEFLEGLKEIFHHLPEEKRICRYYFSGSLKTGLACDNEFDCANCHVHNRFKNVVRFEKEQTPKKVGGLIVDGNVFYHRGHTCLKVERNGYVRVGVDNLVAQCCLGKGRILLPSIGDFIEAGEISFAIEVDGTVLPLVSPVSGEVVAVNSAPENTDNGHGWFAVVKPFNLSEDLQNLLYGKEAANWFKHEISSMTRDFAESGEFAADGGELNFSNIEINWKIFIKHYLLSRI